MNVPVAADRAAAAGAREMILVMPNAFTAFQGELLFEYVGRLRELRLAIDVGDRDRSITTTSKDLHAVLDTYEVKHQFEVYDGDHVSGVSRQLETKVFPFFSASLTFR